MISFSIPVTPIPKPRHRTARLPNGKTIAYNPPGYYSDVEKIITYSRPYFPKEPLTGALSVSIGVFLPVPQSWSQKKKSAAINGEIKPMNCRSDIDNYAKMLLDTLNGQLYADDHQICRLVAEKHYSASPRWEITVERI